MPLQDATQPRRPAVSEAAREMTLDELLDSMPLLHPGHRARKELAKLREELAHARRVVANLMSNRPAEQHRVGRPGKWEEWQMDLDDIANATQFLRDTKEAGGEYATPRRPTVSDKTLIQHVCMVCGVWGNGCIGLPGGRFIHVECAPAALLDTERELDKAREKLATFRGQGARPQGPLFTELTKLREENERLKRERDEARETLREIMLTGTDMAPGDDEVSFYRGQLHDCIGRAARFLRDTKEADGE